jgi:hypothetical protein
MYAEQEVTADMNDVLDQMLISRMLSFRFVSEWYLCT